MVLKENDKSYLFNIALDILIHSNVYKKLKYEITHVYKNNSKTFNILSIDGGGIRGILPAKLLL